MHTETNCIRQRGFVNISNGPLTGLTGFAGLLYPIHPVNPLARLARNPVLISMAVAGVLPRVTAGLEEVISGDRHVPAIEEEVQAGPQQQAIPLACGSSVRKLDRWRPKHCFRDVAGSMR